jgi:hypothetical protein
LTRLFEFLIALHSPLDFDKIILFLVIVIIFKCLYHVVNFILDIRFLLTYIRIAAFGHEKAVGMSDDI